MKAVEVYIIGLIVCVRLDDKRVIQAPFDFFPRLIDKEAWAFTPRISSDGKKIVWEDIDEQIYVKDLLIWND